MDSTTLKQKARELGADLAGIAPIDRFAGTPPDRHPASIFPECRSVIVLGRRILRGSLRGVEEGTNFHSTYMNFGFLWLEDNFLAQTTYDLTCWIETHDFEAVPLFSYREDGMPKGLAVAPDKPAPNVYVDTDLAAQTAGLGQLGLGDIFLTPQYGPRQRFALILTDAELAPDPLPTERVCDNCGACVRACPFAAIHADAPRTVTVAGRAATVATVDCDVCRACPNGAARGPGRGSRPDRLAAACARACMVHLEQKGRVSQSFQHPFRKRAPWARDTFLRPVPVRAEDPL
jgi:epoxyqueuosine reductase QueG